MFWQLDIFTVFFKYFVENNEDLVQIKMVHDLWSPYYNYNTLIVIRYINHKYIFRTIIYTFLRI